MLWPKAGFFGRLDVIWSHHVCSSCHALHRHQQLSPHGWSPSTWHTRVRTQLVLQCALINGSCAQRRCSPRAHMEAPSCIIGTFSHGSFPQAAEKSVEVNVRYLDWSNAAQPFDIKPNRSCLVICSPLILLFNIKPSSSSLSLAITAAVIAVVGAL